MLNQVILVGKLVEDPTLRTLDDGTNQTVITLKIQKKYKNPETGEYDSDVIPCKLWNGVAESTVEYCKKGAVLGVKASLTTTDEGLIEVNVEKVTFINTKGE